MVAWVTKGIGVTIYVSSMAYTIALVFGLIIGLGPTYPAIG